VDEREETTERLMSPMAAALWTVALTLLAQVCVGVTQAARPGAEVDIVNLAACEVLATSIIVFAMARVHARDVSLRKTLGLRPIAVLHVPLSIAAGAGLCPLLSTADAMILRRWPIDDAAAVESLHKVISSSSPPVFVLTALVVMPLAHEVFFRGIVYGGIERSINARVALLATAVFYACSYLQWQDMPTAFALGVALAWLRERTRTVLAPILAQLALGAVDGIPILRGHDPAADVTYPPKWIAGGAVIALLALVAVGTGRRE
jgi:membrane protease YdiL (CAAX protease family)